MKKVKFGIIGVGNMGRPHAQTMAKSEEAEVTAIADVNFEAARAVADEVGAQAFGDYKQLIRKGGVEAIIIATPHLLHPPVAAYAARHGVHVLSEKPLAVAVSQADKMIEACRDANVLLGVVFQQRTEAARIKMKSMVDEGVLGTLHRVAMSAPWYRPQSYYDSGSWRGTWNGEGGGILMNQAPHSLDQFLWIGGKPKSAQAIAATRLHNIEVENLALSILDYGNGKVGWIYASTAEIPLPERFEVVGDQGVLVLESGKLRHYETKEPLSQHLGSSPEPFGHLAGEWRDVKVEKTPEGHIEVILAFARAVRANDASLLTASGEDGLASLELANTILLAGFKRREIDFPLDRKRYDKLLKKLQKDAKDA